MTPSRRARRLLMACAALAVRSWASPGLLLGGCRSSPEGDVTDRLPAWMRGDHDAVKERLARRARLYTTDWFLWDRVVRVALMLDDLAVALDEEDRLAPRVLHNLRELREGLPALVVDEASDLAALIGPAANTARTRYWLSQRAMALVALLDAPADTRRAANLERLSREVARLTAIFEPWAAALPSQEHVVRLLREADAARTSPERTAVRAGMPACCAPPPSTRAPSRRPPRRQMPRPPVAAVTEESSPMRHPTNRTRHRRVALTAALAAAFACGSPGTATADLSPTTALRPERAVADSSTVHRVFGLVDPAWRLADTNGDGVTVLDPAAIGPWLNTVYGRVVDVDGTPVAGMPVTLSLLRNERSTGPEAPLATTETNAAGLYVLNVPVTSALVEEAKFGNGTVNMFLDATRTTGQDVTWMTLHGAGAIYSSMFAYGGGTSLAMAPVNVGVLTVASVAASGSVYGVANPPDNDPYDPNTPPASERPTLPAGIGGTIDTIGMPSDPGIDTAGLDALLAVGVDVPVEPIAAPMPPEDEDPLGGDDKCRKPRNQAQWHTDAVKNTNVWMPVGEIHSWLGMKSAYAYAESAKTNVGAALNVEAKGWKISGSVDVTNNGQSTSSGGYREGEQAVPYEAEFVSVYEKRTWCPTGYDEDRGPTATHEERITTTKWTGGTRYGSRALSGDGWDAYRKAKDQGRSMTMYPKQTYKKNSGKTFKFTFGVSAYGVGLYAESTMDTKHRVTIITTERLKDWHVFGDVDVPASDLNHVLYVSG
jgi:hypothetical protein